MGPLTAALLTAATAAGLLLVGAPAAVVNAVATGAAALWALLHRPTAAVLLRRIIGGALLVFATADLAAATGSWLAEPLYLLGYFALLAAALRCLWLVGGQRQLREGLVDAAVLAIVLLGLLYRPMAAAAGDGSLHANAAYFLATAGLTALWMRLVLTRPDVSVARLLTSGALLLGLVSTTADVVILGGIPVALDWLLNGSARWALAIGVTHASFVQLVTPVASQRERDTIGRMMVMTVVLLGAAVSVAVVNLHHVTGAAALAVVAPALLAPLVVQRVITSTRAHVLVQARQRRRSALDPLTGLRNEVGLLTTLAQHAPGADHTHLVLLALPDLRTLLHDVPRDLGDRIVMGLRSRLATELARGEVAARCDTDEFAVVTTRDPDALARRLVTRLSRVLVVEDTAVTISPSIRAGWAPVTDDPAATLAHARFAAARSVENGTPAGFDATLAASHERRREVLHRLPDAIVRGDVVNHYQPIARLEDGLVVGFEALARWNDPELGRVGPMEFIPVAESSGAIVALGTRLLRQACRDLSTWRRELGRDDLYVTVNVSARQLDDAAFPAVVAAALRAADLPATALTIELTEGVLLRENAEQAEAALLSIRALGVRLALDDFGTGYSSLAYLQRFRPDVVKVDRAFTRELHSEARDVATGVFAMLEQLGWPVVAEGIELPESIDTLRGLSCELGQGYLLSPPLPSEGVDRLLVEGLAELCRTTTDGAASDRLPSTGPLSQPLLDADVVASAIRPLVTDASIVAASTPTGEVERLLRQSPHLGLLVLRAEDGTLSTLAPNRVFNALAGQFAYGRAVHGTRPIGELGSDPVRPIPAATTYVDAVAVALSRTDDQRYEDLVVVEDDRVGLLSVGRLLEALAESLADQASRDHLTGIPNRRHLLGQLTTAIEAGSQFGLLLLDLDDFKPINDRHGHAAGDAVLMAVARRLRSCARARDVVARLGGDEFAVLVHGDGASTDRLADRAAAAIAEPIVLADGTTVAVAASVGSTWGSWFDADAALAEADAAMYDHKRSRSGSTGATTHATTGAPSGASG